MPVKIARSTPRPSFGLPELLVAIPHLASGFQGRCQIATIHAGFGVIRGMSVEGSAPSARVCLKSNDLFVSGEFSMIANLSLETLLAEPPKLYEHEGQLIPWPWGIDARTCLELNGRLKPGMNTLETGGGLSTIIFAASGCQHTCIMPDNALANNIQNYCRSASIDTSKVRFIISKSCDVIHQLSHSAYDLILIDGCHGFPSVFVDFCYSAKALKLGGALIVDDLHIYTCDLIASFMRSDPGWNVELITTRVAVAIKVSDTIDNEWTNQPFVVFRSKPSSVIKNPLYFARLAARTLRAEGARVTAKKILRKMA